MVSVYNHGVHCSVSVQIASRTLFMGPFPAEHPSWNDQAWQAEMITTTSAWQVRAESRNPKQLSDNFCQAGYKSNVVLMDVDEACVSAYK